MPKIIELVSVAGLKDASVVLLDDAGAEVESVTVTAIGDADTHYRGTFTAGAGSYRADIREAGSSLGGVESVELGDAADQLVKVRDTVKTDEAAAVWPAPSLVAEGTKYGPTGQEYTGTAQDLGPVPDPSDVREGVTTGAQTGTIHLPPTGKVEEGYGYGADSVELIGTGPAPSGTPTIPPVIDADGVLTLIRGDDYDGAMNKVPTWTIPDDWPDLTDASAKFAYRGTSGNGEWDATINGQDVEVPLSKDQTAKVQSSSDYRYDVQITFQSGKVRTLAFGAFHCLDTYTDP